MLSWNPGAERLFGYSAAEMIGRSITRLFPPERITEEDLLLTSIARGERVANFETVRVRKDGSPVNVSVTLSPLRDEMGRIVGASKIARDTTERQRMIASLAEQTERFRVTLQSIADAVIATDARGNIDFVNPVAQRLTGWLQGEAVGRPIEQVFSIVSEHTGARVENRCAAAWSNSARWRCPNRACSCAATAPSAASRTRRHRSSTAWATCAAPCSCSTT